MIHPENKETMEYTFAMIKPDAVRAKNSGKIIDMIEANGFEIVRMEKGTLTKDEASTFYAVHEKRPFFGEMIESIISGPVVVMALQKENAVQAWRDLIGATDPAQAAEGTIRKKFGTSIGNNAVHGSDSDETAELELGFFFPDLMDMEFELDDEGEIMFEADEDEDEEDTDED